MTPRPLSEGNWLQRRYHAWASAHYARLPAALAAEVERLDRWIYSRHGLALWAGLLAGLAVTVAGLIVDGGLPWPLALGSALVLWVGLPLVALGAWLQPQKFTARRMLRNALVIGLLAYGGALAGFLIARIARLGRLQTETLAEALGRSVVATLPVLAVGLAAMVLLLWGVAQIRSAQDRRALAQLSLEQARDAAARQAAQAQLHLLQAQIQPHFLFNTLAALQHWVDSGDPRAGGLLRDLTAFLRGSTELLARPEVTLAEEVEAVQRYLRIMQARLGERLRFEVAVAPDCADARLPTGLLLTLVENAVEHGIAPSLAGGTVRLTAARRGGGVQVAVADDGAGLAAEWQDGTGLANCRERLRHLGGDGATMNLRRLQPGTEAMVHLPGAAP